MREQRLMGRFSAVVENWLRIMSRTKKLTFFTNGFSQASVVFPIIVVSPAYFAGSMQLGGLTQTAGQYRADSLKAFHHFWNPQSGRSQHLATYAERRVGNRPRTAGRQAS